MALSTQIVLLCLCSFLVESFFFELGGQDLQRIPLGLTDFMLYPGMFDRPHIRYPHHHPKDNIRGKQKYIYTSGESTTAKYKVIDPVVPITTTEGPTTISNDEDVAVKTQTTLKQEPLEDQKVFLTKKNKVNNFTEISLQEDKDTSKDNQRVPFTSADVTTEKSRIPDPSAPVTTIEEPLTSGEYDIEVKIQRSRKHEPLENQTVFLTRYVNINDATEATSDEKDEELQANALSIHDVKPEPILSITMPHDSEEERNKNKVEGNTEISTNIDKINDTTTESTPQENKGDPGLSKQTDFLLVPVAAVNPSTFNVNQNSILNRNPNTMAPMANLDNYQNNNPVYSTPNGQNNLNPGVQFGNTPNQNINTPGIISYQDSNRVYPNGPNNLNSGIPYGNAPNQYINNVNPGLPISTSVVNPSNNVAPNDLYTMMTVPSNGQGINNGNNNMYYLQNNPNPMNNMGYQNPNTQQLYSLVPINNAPNNAGWNQQPNFIPSNNQQYFVPINNQPNNGIPINNQPNNFVPFNNQPNNFVGNRPNNFVPVNNQPNNFVPFNTQPNSFVPVNSQPNNFISSNQPNNYVPWNGQPNNYPYNNNFVPVNNVPNNYVPINNGPNNFVPLNNQPNFVPFNEEQNIVPLDNQPLVPNNNAPVIQGVIVEPQPNTVTLISLKDKEGDGTEHVSE
ncbi:GATA zinc finger domain-containing protein 14-like [Pectinophora gossypiella]|uniref:GATA zinc finger domain-containing protein 14-like n=1 Tax=Pectinophora gossypiella TaxID=13191 RepID=UPI00214F01F4|nr:GATA zinc finger domain-containing protein 14-like [Pectinophora gossypiella]